MTGFGFSISERSAGISWPPPAQPVAAGAAPDGRSGALAAVAAGPVEAAALPFGAAEALASPSAAAVRPGVAAQPVLFEAAARPAEQVLEAPQPVWEAEVAAEPHWAVAPIRERPAWLPGLEPNRRHSVAPPAHSPPADLAARVSRWDLAYLERVPSRLGAQEVSPSRPRPAMHWLSATLVPEATHWGMRLWATAYSAQFSDRTVCRERLAWLPD